MDTMAVGQKLVELCQQGKNMEAVEALYDPKIVSIEVESAGDETMPARMEGIEAIRKKGEWWYENHEIHGGSVTGPFPHGDRFIVLFNYEITPKTGPTAGKRMKLEEAGLYTVRNGKILQEEFFYHM